MSKPCLPNQSKSANKSISLRPSEWAILDQAAKQNGLYRSQVIKVLIRQAADARLPIFRKD